jgi:hypothetical protein
VINLCLLDQLTGILNSVLWSAVYKDTEKSLDSAWFKVLKQPSSANEYQSLKGWTLNNQIVHLLTVYYDMWHVINHISFKKLQVDHSWEKMMMPMPVDENEGGEQSDSK